MKKLNLENFIRGWIVGDFEPALFKNKDVEVALQRYKTGQTEQAHRHDIATEYTIITKGVFRMKDEVLRENDIVVIEPGEAVDFECLEEGATLVIKTPSVKGDKYDTSGQFMPLVNQASNKVLNIVIPMAGAGSRFKEAGYTFPKPLIDVNGKPMIQLVIENLKPNCPHKFIFICQKEHYETYSLNEIFNNLVGRENYECVQLTSMTQGAACTVLTAVEHISNDNDLIIANSDQLIDVKLDDYINFSRNANAQGTIMTFESSHPKWSYARLDEVGNVLEVAEKKVISNKATVGVYYFSEGRRFVEGVQKMIAKDIRVNNEFYVCPTYNELIIDGHRIKTWDILREQMHGLGTPEDLQNYLTWLEKDR